MVMKLDRILLTENSKLPALPACTLLGKVESPKG